MESTVVRRISPDEYLRQFEKIGDLGKGAFGTVFAATELEKNRSVTLKMVAESRSIYDDDEFMAMRKLAGCPYVPDFLKAFKVGYDKTFFVFKYEAVIDLKKAWR